MFARFDKSLHRLLVFLENIKKWVVAENFCTELYLYIIIGPVREHSWSFTVTPIG